MSSRPSNCSDCCRHNTYYDENECEIVDICMLHGEIIINTQKKLVLGMNEPCKRALSSAFKDEEDYGDGYY